MIKGFKESFLVKWEKYFGKAEPPIAFYYTDKVPEQELKETSNRDQCLIGNVNAVRSGRTFVYSTESAGCAGGKRFTGFSQKLRPDIKYFLSCGIPGKMEGERHKKSPEVTAEFLKNYPRFAAPGKYLVFKRWDKLAEVDNPAAVIFFATPDVLSGLFVLANYDTADLYGVIAPTGSGCSSIIAYPLAEAASSKPRCVLGMFDVTARPCVPADKLTFTIPINRFKEMVENMDESFLITGSWTAMKNRPGFKETE
jgi:uncharacterized protein (DUF169 family)